MTESDTWKGRENLENAKEAVEEFEKEYWQDIEDVRKQEREKGTFKEENCQDSSQQENYLGGQTKDMMKNTGQGQKELETMERRKDKRTKNYRNDKGGRRRRNQTGEFGTQGVDRRR